jgi:hypothetical protein
MLGISQESHPAGENPCFAVKERKGGFTVKALFLVAQPEGTPQIHFNFRLPGWHGYQKNRLNQQKDGAHETSRMNTNPIQESFGNISLRFFNHRLHG